MQGLAQNLPQTKTDPPRDPGGSDADLVAQAKAGDAQAFALLYRRHVEHVFNFVVLQTGDREAAQDITQTIWLRALANLHQSKNDARFVGWLFAIARNVIADTYRAQKTMPVVFDDLHTIPDDSESPESRSIRLEDEQTFRRLREHCLTAPEREILDLRLQELNDKEIAVALGRSHGTIRNIQYRIVRKLRTCFTSALRQEAGHHA